MSSIKFNLKKKKYLALLAIVVIVIGIIGLFTFGRIDKYKGKIKIKNVVSKTSSLSASISATATNELESKGSDIIKYEIGYTMDAVTGVETRDVILRATLSDEEGRYARFKEINGTNITSTLSNDGKTIEVYIDDAPLGVENNITLKVNINNAPNGFKIKPDVTIQESTGETKTVTVNEVEVVTNSIEGTVKDEKGLIVSNIELSLNGSNGEVKRTYSGEDGKYVFSDIENGNYTIKVEEEIYESVGNAAVTDGGILNIVVKEVTPYELEAHKYITKLDLVVNGKEEKYTYNDLEKVAQNVKNARTISGKISYKISIKNIGEKAGRISKITDTVDKGLSFDKNKNLGWKEKEGKLYYEMAEGSVINSKETKDITLVLDIKNTNQIKTYINEADVNGETYERVVYILNGAKYREEDVILGEKLVEPVISNPSFSGWYTDRNFTNKYNFKNEVTKDLILYGKTETIKHNVEFYDKNPQTSEETKWAEQEVEDGKKATEPNSPSHEGYEFECWMDEQDNIWNFNNPVERDLRLTSCYSLVTYKITYDGLTEEEKTAINNPPTYTIETPTITLANPNNRSDDYGETEAFIGWTGSNGDSPSSVVKIEQGSTGDKHYIANFQDIEEDEYTILYDLDGGELEEGKTNPSKYKKRTETFTLNNPSKDYYDFIGWTGTGLSEMTTTVTVPKGSEGNREYVAHYQRRTHNVIFNDYDVESDTPEETVTPFGDPSTVNEGEPVDQPATNPTHTGYTCDKWSTKINGNYNDDAYNFSTPILNDINLYTLCKKNPYTVTYMDGDLQYATDTVLYKEKATKPADDPVKNHHIFTGWTLNGQLFDFNTPITEDITLYSSYEEVKAPEVSHTPTEWTNQDVVVTVSKNSELVDATGYTYKYRVEDGSYGDYSNPFDIGENCDVYAIAYKNNVASEETKHEIRNIDKIKPTITNLSASQILKNGFTISISGYDHESGLHEFRIYKDDEYVSTINYTGETAAQTTTYTFTGLEEGTVYNVKVIAVDVATNTSEASEIDVETTKEEKIVAQITHNNGVELAEYIPLSSLYKGLTYNQDGVNCNTEQCTIQMLDNVTETNDVLEGQDITLDLNGFNINGLTDYTFTNNGNFKVIDTVEMQIDEPTTMVDYIKSLQSTNTSLKTDSTADENLRYVGSNPNNYVRFNNELWRIVGVMNNTKSSEIDDPEPRIKLVRASSIGSYAWDTSALGVNNGYGINEWSQADVMKLLNPGFDQEEVGGSLYYNSKSGSCYSGRANGTKTCDFTSVGLKSSAKDMIEPTLWYTGSTGSITTNTNYTPTNLYNYERGTRKGKICSSGSYCNDTVTRTTSWTGMVGLISPSDYAFATSETSCTSYLYSWSNSCKNNDWLRTSGWSIMAAGNTSNADYVYYISGGMSGTDAYNQYNVYPSVYLKSDLLYKSGTGTSTDPFILMTDGEYQNMIAANTNGIKNSTDTAVINNGTFTLGNIDGTADTVSEIKPYIEGERFGVSNTNIFNFYDGKIKGTTAINGEVTDTPYPYNAIVSVVDEGGVQKQIATLKVVTDPEARIGTVYYSKVQKAVDEANKGYYVDAFSEAEFFDSLQGGNHDFYYDSVTNTYRNSGNYEATSYLYMDFSEYEHDQELSIRTNKAGWDTGTITIRENDANGKVVYSTTLNISDEDQINKYVLEKGKRYYLEFHYVPYSSFSYRKSMIIKDIRIADYTQSDSEIIDKTDLKTEYSNYYFEYDENDHKLKSNNKNIPSSVAFSYMEIDLSTATEDKELIVNATMHTYGTSSYGNVVVSEENTILTSANSNGMLYMNGKGSSSYNKVGPYNSSKKLEKGKKYYLQFYYFRGSDTAVLPEDGLYINSIKLIPYIEDISKKTSIIEEGITPGDYGFEKSNCSYTTDGICASRVNNNNNYVHHTYFKVDLTDSTEDMTLGYDIRATQSANIDFYGVVTDSVDFPERSEDVFFSYTSTEKIQNFPTLKKGKINYVHFVVKQDGYYTRIGELYLTKGTSIDLSKFITPGQYGFIKNTSNNYYQPNNSGPGSYAHSYLKIDMTGDTSEKYVAVNLSASNGLGIYATETTDMPMVDKNSDGYVKNTGDSYSGNGYIQLIPNKINYLHFVSEENASVSIYDAKILSGHYYNLASNLKTSGQYGFDSVDTYNSDSMIPSYPTAISDSYLKIDMKDATSDKLLRINAYDYYSDFYIYISNTKDNVDYGSIAWNTRQDMLIMNRYSNNYEYYYMNGSYTTNGFMDYDFVLTKGSTYYVHFGSTSSSSNYKLRLKSVFTYNIDNVYMSSGSNTLAHPSSSSVPPKVPNVITEQTDNSFRFIGKNPKNIVKFNNELWRIIGVFETEDENGNTDRRIKLVRNNSIGNFSWDASENTTDGGYGFNEWSQADIMKLLNPGYENNKEKVYEIASGETKEVKASNSLYWNKGKGLCFIGGGNYVGSDTKDFSTDTNCDFTETGLSDEAKQYIDTVKWGTTGYTQYISSGSAYDFLNQERQSNTDAFTPTSVTGLDTGERNASWIGKVGLVYPSDVYLASGDYVGTYSTVPRSSCVSAVGNTNCIQYSNWLNSYRYLWTITPYWRDNNPTSVVNMYSYGQYTYASNIYPVRPTVYLSPNTVISGGTGTAVDPYTLSLGDTKNPKTNYGLDEPESQSTAGDVAYEGDTIIFDDDTLKTSTLYGFTYNEEGDYFINDNKGKESSIATSYIPVDMTNETENKTLFIKYDLSSSQYNDFGHINIIKDTFVPVNYSGSYYSTSIFNDSGIKSGYKEYELEAGHMYYIQFGYVKKSSQEVTPEIRDDFKVTVLLKDENEYGTTFTRYDGLAPVLNQDVDTVHLLKNVTAPATVNIVDTQNVILDLNGYTLTTTASAPVVTNNGSLKIIDSKFEEDQEASINLQKQYDSEYDAAVAAQQEIKDRYSLDSYESENLLFNYNAESNDVSSSTIKNLVDDSDVNLHLTSYEDTTKGLVFKGSGYAILGEYNPNKLTVESTFKLTSLGSQLVIGNYEAGGYAIYVNASNELVVGVSVDGSYQEIKMPDVVTNIKYTVALTYDEDKVIMYVNGEKYGELQVTAQDKSITNPTKNTHVALGTNPVRDEPYNQYFTGVIYTARIYSSALSAEKIASNYQVDSGLIQDPITRQIVPIDYTNMGGTITSSITNTILNNKGAYLEIDAGNINNVNGSSSSIYNIGSLKVNENTKITATNRGISNTGTILPSGGIINANYGIVSSSETGIEGFTINVTGSNGYGISGGKANIENVEVTANSSGYALSASNSTASNSNFVGTVYISNTSIDNSTISGNIKLGAGGVLNNCNLNTSTIEVDPYSNSAVAQINNSINSSSLTVSSGTVVVNNSNLSGKLDIKSGYTYSGSAVLNDSKIAGAVSNDGISLIVNSSQTGVITNKKNLTVKNKSEVTSIYAIGGTINIGEDDGTVSTTYPKIGARIIRKEAYSTTPILNFYDGVITGSKNYALNMPVTGSPEGYDLDVNIRTNYEDITLKPYDSTTEKDYVAQIGSTKYASLKKAVEAVNENGELEEIIVLKPIYSLLRVDIPETKNVKINLNDNYIYAYSTDYYFNNNGTLNLYNSGTLTTDNTNYSTTYIINNGTLSSDNFDIKKNNHPIYGPIIINNGLYNYNSGDIVLRSTVYNGQYDDNTEYIELIVNNENATMNITGGNYDTNKAIFKNAGTITYNPSTSSKLQFALLANNLETGTINIVGTNSNLVGNTFMFNAGTANISNVNNVSLDSVAVLGYNSGTMNISDSKFKKLNSSTLYYDNSPPNSYSSSEAETHLMYRTIENFIKNVYKINSLRSPLFNVGELTITDSELYIYKASSYYRTLIMSDDDSKLVLDGSSFDNSVTTVGTLLSTAGNTDLTISSSTFTKRPIQISGNTTATINDITVTNADFTISGTAVVDLLDGTIDNTSKDNGILVSDSSTLNLGKKGDGVVSTTKPLVKARTNAINVGAGEFNFYDGYVASSKSIFGTVNDIEDGYAIKEVTHELGEASYLEVTNVIANVTQDKVYSNIQLAFSEAVSGDYLKMTDNATVLKTANTITITPDMELTLNLNGYNISINNKFIINNGIFNIENQCLPADDPRCVDNSYDDGGGGIVYSYISNFIENNNTLNITGGGFTNRSGTDMFYNKGTMVLNMGGYYYLAAGTSMINNEGSNATLTINGHDASSNFTLINSSAGDMIQNLDGAELTITGGLFDAESGSVIRNNDSIVTISGGEYTTNSIRVPGRSTSRISDASSYMQKELIINEGNSEMTITGGQFTNYLDYYPNTRYGYNSTNYSTYYNNKSLNIGTIYAQKVLIANKDSAVLDVTDATFNGSNNPAVVNTSTGTATITDATSSIGGLYSTTFINEENSTMIVDGGSFASTELIVNKGTATVKDISSNINNIGFNISGTLNVNNVDSASELRNKATANVTGSELTTVITYMDSDTTITNTSVTKNIEGNHASNINLVSSTVTNSEETENLAKDAIQFHSNGTLDIKESTVSSSKKNGIALKRGFSSIVNIGEKDNNAHKDKVLIKGSQYGIYLDTNDESNLEEQVNFYDGKIEGEIPIKVPIHDVETDYVITTDDNNTYKTAYLSQGDIAINVDTNVKYNDLNQAFSAASSGNTIKLLSDYYVVATYSPLTIASGKNIIFDIDGHDVFMARTQDYIVNNGTLTIKDSSNSGTVYGIARLYSLIENNGTLTIDSIKFDNLIINNKATITIDDVDFSYVTINHNSTSNNLTINGGTFTNRTNITSTNSSKTIINGGTFSDLYIINNNSSSLNITGGTITEINVFNNDTSSTTLDGGTFGTFAYNKVHFVNNEGCTMTINDATINTLVGSCTKDDPGIIFSNPAINNSGTLTINDGTFTYSTSSRGDDKYSGPFVYNSLTGTATIKDAKFNDGENTRFGGIINNIGTATIENVKTNNNFVAYNSGTILIKGISYVRKIGNYSRPNDIFYNRKNGTMTIENCNISYSGSNNAEASPMVENVSGALTIKDTTLSGYSSSALIVNNRDGSAYITGNSLTIIGNTKITATSGAAINYVAGDSLTIGEKGNGVSVTYPEIIGETYGLNTLNTYSQINYYDGVLRGQIPLQSRITDLEPNYEIVSGVEDDVNYVKLKLAADIERIAVVNNINYDSLQAAVNACPTDGTTGDITIYTNITLNEALNVAEGKNIKVHLNGFTVTPEEYVTNHTGTGSIEIVTSTPGGAGGAIYRFFANITGTEINPKDIVIYQMDNGEELSPATTYKLYKLMDGKYKVVRVKENEIGDYSLGAEKEILRTTTGQINIKGVGEGTYKLVGSDSKELTFDINENSVSSNIRVDRYSSKAKQTIHVVATLILTLQTGVIRQPFVVVISILLLTTIGFITYKKYRKEDLK